MRIVLSAAVALVAATVAAVPVLAQSYDAERARLEAQQLNQQIQAQQQLDMARQSALAAQREADAAADRLRTEVTIQGIDNQRRAQARRGVAPTPASDLERRALDARMQADDARIDALTDRILADSNARVRAESPGPK